MDSSAKRQRLNKRILIRLCDKFTRTEVDVICPLIKAENSIRVLYKVQRELLYRVLSSSGDQANVSFKRAHWKYPPDGQENEGNLFIEYASLLPNQNSAQILKQELELQLAEILKGNYILAEHVQDVDDIVPQPLISEFDFELHKLKLCFEKLNEEAKTRAELYLVEESIMTELEEVEESYTTFAVLSQNGKGKSFILNLLLLMTSDNQEEYSKNNSAIQLPQGFPNKVPWDKLKESDVRALPDVMKNFIRNKEDNARKPVCYLLQNDTDIEASLESFKKIGSCFSEKRKADFDPYVLPQKDDSGAYESTTKCIIHLRYGVRYQMQVEYFNKEELQQQFFELFVTKENLDAENVNEDIMERSIDCLKARYQILTGCEFSEEDSIGSSTDIELSEEALSFAGKIELYVGKGENPTHDRLALQSVLKALTTAQEEDESKADESKRKIAAVKQIVVYLPSKILHGGKELLEMPGTDESDPIAMDFITKALKKVDAVILVSEHSFKLGEKEVKQILTDSKYMKRFERDPSGNKLMLLAYPEKTSNFQYTCEDEERIKKLEREEKKKRDVEIKAIGNMLKKMSSAHEASIFTTYLLPVLHSSILSQKDPVQEHKVVAKYLGFLRYTGIEKLCIQLDDWVLSREKFIFDQAKKKLEDFQNLLNDTMSPETAKSILQLFDKEHEFQLKSLREKHQKLDTELHLKIVKLLESAEEVEKAFTENLPVAVRNWNAEKNKVTSIGVYSPYFCGKNPIYKVCLYPIFFDGFEDQKEEIFCQILSDIEKILKQYKSDVIDLYSREFDDLLRRMGISVPSDFVKIAIESKLDDALQWYKGKKKCPFNKKTLEKLMEKSQRESLKSVILQKNFKKCTVEEAKEKTAADMEACFMKVQDLFTQKVIDLHNQRFKSLKSQLWTPRNGPSKIWKLLEQEMKSLSRDKEMRDLQQAVGKLFEMMSVSLNTQGASPNGE